MRLLLALLTCLNMLWLTSTSALAQNKERYVFAIVEGGHSKIVSKDIAPRYKDMAADLSRLLKKPVDLDIVVDYKTLTNGLNAEKYDLAFIHPTQITMAALNTKKYLYIASEKYHLDYQVHFIVNGNSNLKTWADLKDPKVRDKTLALPMQDSLTSAMAKIMVTELLGEFKQYTYTAQEDALPFASENGSTELESLLFLMKNGLAALGASASLAVVNDWKTSGGRVIYTSPKVPVKNLIATNKLSVADKEALSAYFIGLDKTEAGKRKLQQPGFAGFVALEPSKIDAHMKWFNR